MLTTTVDILDAAELGRRLRALRIEVRREWLEDCADRLGVSARELGAVERGEMGPDWLSEHPEVAREMGL